MLRTFWVFGDKSMVARMTGVTSSQLSDYLKGRVRPSWKRATALAEACRRIGLDFPPQWWRERRENV